MTPRATAGLAQLLVKCVEIQAPLIMVQHSTHPFMNLATFTAMRFATMNSIAQTIAVIRFVDPPLNVTTSATNFVTTKIPPAKKIVSWHAVLDCVKARDNAVQARSREIRWNKIELT